MYAFGLENYKLKLFLLQFEYMVQTYILIICNSPLVEASLVSGPVRLVGNVTVCWPAMQIGQHRRA